MIVTEDHKSSHLAHLPSLKRIFYKHGSDGPWEACRYNICHSALIVHPVH